MFCYGFLQFWNLGLLLLDNAPQMLDAIVVGQLIFGHLKPGRARNTVGNEEQEEKYFKITLQYSGTIVSTEKTHSKYIQ